MNETIPTYAADYFLIKLPSELQGIVKERDFDFSSARETSLFLHEWFHYLHNISTADGIYAFATLVNLWARFRSVLNEDGLNPGELSVECCNKEEIHRHFLHWMSSRRFRNNADPILRNYSRTDCEITEAQLITEFDIDITGERTSFLRCELQTDSNEQISVEIGTVEILEGVASMLEASYLISVSEFPSASKVVPYQLLLKLSRYIVHDIKDDEATACGIAALQDNDPPRALFEILHRAKQEASGDRLLLLENLVKNHLKSSKEVMDLVFQQTESFFPMDEPMSSNVKGLVAAMRANIAAREIDPFFEFAVIKTAKANPERLKLVIAELTCPRVLVRTKGDENEIGRDQIVRFGFPAGNAVELQFGGQKLHAALHFLTLHLGAEGFLPTAQLTAGQSRRKCPFYTSCLYPLRQENPEICADRPWVALSIPTHPLESCWYRAGVRATRKPIEEFFSIGDWGLD
jgi:hypothetical protein